MTNDNKPRKRRENRPTDSFGGPNPRGNTISLTVVLIAFAFFLVLQWTGGDPGKILQGTATMPTSAPGETRQRASSPAPTVENGAPAAQATVAQKPTATLTATTGQGSVQTPRATVHPTPTANAPPAQRASDLPTIAYADLPPEAHETIALIEEGGPFPFSRDGITFQNRERLLPRHPEGYYREYTVITPGIDNRGARRVVTGEGGEMYYTDDHYESFREIIR